MTEPITLRAVTSRPQQQPPKPSILEALLRLEGEAIAAQDSLSLRHIAVNRPRDIGVVHFREQTNLILNFSLAPDLAIHDLWHNLHCIPLVVLKRLVTIEMKTYI